MRKGAEARWGLVCVDSVCSARHFGLEHQVDRVESKGKEVWQAMRRKEKGVEGDGTHVENVHGFGICG